MNTFEILVYAIAALTLVIVLIVLIPVFFPQENPLTEIKNSLGIAQSQTMEGKTVQLGYLNFPSTFFSQAVDLADKSKVIVSYECNNPTECCVRKSDSNSKVVCDKAIEWDYDFVKLKSTKRLLTSIRCIRIEGLPTCKVYIGSIPAQAKINKIEIVGENTGATQIKLTLKNVGNIQIPYGTNTLALYKKSSNEWKITDYSSEIKQISTIAPQESTTVFWDIAPENLGEYKAEFTFDGLNAGKDTNYIVFNKTTNSNCMIDESTTDTIQNPTTGLYEENHYCTGCNYPHECVGAWSKKMPGKVFSVGTKDQTYCTKTSYEGNC